MTEEKSKNIELTKSSKEISFTPFFTNLLKPTAEMAGLEIKDFFKEKIDTWKEKRRNENIAGHVKKVQEQLERDASEKSNASNSIKQLELFAEWADGAQEIDANEGIIAELWQKLLVEIANGNFPNKDLIDKLKNITPEEAKILLKTGENKTPFCLNEKDLHYLESLESLGLVKSSNIIPFTFFIFFIWSFLIFVLDLFLRIFSVNNSILKTDSYNGLLIDNSSYQLLLLSFPILAIIIGFYQIYKKKKLHMWRLTWAGIELVKGAVNVRKKNNNHP